MSEKMDRINQLSQHLEELLKKHESFTHEINGIRAELARLQRTELMLSENDPAPQTDMANRASQNPEPIVPVLEHIDLRTVDSPSQTGNSRGQENGTGIVHFENRQVMSSTDTTFEKYIGENLISKIGIVITIIGVGIGAKYSIDNNLISPAMRIALGYVVGALLLLLGLKLKSKYLNYSSVLVSGSMAIMYFITYFAFVQYDIFSQTIAFLLMAIFTIFTVLIAIKYDRQIIAHIGFVGAIAVPFLLSDGSGKIAVFYAYLTIVNVGILLIAVQKYWKSLYINAFTLTWLVFLSWKLFQYNSANHFNLVLIYATVFFFLFYATFLVYKLVKQEKFHVTDVILVLTNSFVYFSVVYSMLDEPGRKGEYLGLFTLANGLVHSAVCFIIYKHQKSDQNLFYLIGGLSLVFITMAVPVQLDGNAVTMLWIGEAAVLFWIGRTRSAILYERLSLPMLSLATLSLFHDWYDSYSFFMLTVSRPIPPLLNIHFLSSVLFIATSAFIAYTNFKQPQRQENTSSRFWSIFPTIFISGVLVFTTYMAFVMEIGLYWNQKIIAVSNPSGDLETLMSTYRIFVLEHKMEIWLIIFTMLYSSILSRFIASTFQNQLFSYILLFLNFGIMLVFLIAGLSELSKMRTELIRLNIPIDISYYISRYASIFCAALLLYGSSKIFFGIRERRIKQHIFEISLHTSILWIISSELMHWLDLSSASGSNKLGLSILWGLYALFLIIYGIWKINQPLRIAAMLLFAFTLIKVFFYDIAHLDTISKTVVFVSLGLLLLIVSFLYNKYTSKIDQG